ncbi:MAG TPA: M24 family metallopeptidase [Steroidobacteraceae bacterium]|nr:M24 family metallopeptidase [Steroidobacteraceae bacterium]
MRANHETNESVRVERLLDAQAKAAQLFAQVDRAQILRPGVSDTAASDAVRDLAAAGFGVQRHWHKRIVRSGPNTLRPYQEDAPDRIMTEDDIVFADFGPVFAGWEADFGRTWVIGQDPTKLRLRDDLEQIFRAGRRFFDSTPELTAADMYAQIVRLSGERGWRFGNYHCGHVVGEFPHENFQGDKVHSLITAGNHAPLRGKDPSDRTAHWILEVHLVDEARSFGGFYEELLTI